MTVLVYGTMVHVALAAAEESGIDAEIIDLRTLLPLDIDTIVDLGEEDRPLRHRARGDAARDLDRKIDDKWMVTRRSIALCLGLVGKCLDSFVSGQNQQSDFPPACLEFHLVHHRERTSISRANNEVLAFPRYLFLDRDRGIPNSSRNLFEGFFLRLRILLRSMTTSRS